MKTLALLLCLTAAALSAEPITVVVDSIEVNEIIDQHGYSVFRQAWYLEWDWQEEDGSTEPVPVSRGWRRIKPGDEPVIIPGAGAVDTFEESGHTWQIIAPSISYTTTSSDPETRCREIGAYRPICP